MSETDQQAAGSVVTCPNQGWRAESVAVRLDDIFHRQVIAACREVAGYSVEGRPVEMVQVGDGPRTVLAWSQMHGDEQTYTSVVLRLLNCLITDAEAITANAIRQGVRLCVIPMLNPDGAARRSRFTANGVDLNRDARQLATPEARILHDAVRRLRPDFGFNLHNQNHRRRLPSGEGPVSLSLLTPPRDTQNTQTATTLAARKVAARIVRVTKPECEGRVGRYGADYMPRAFGEWIQSQDVATVLLEAGGWPGGDVMALETLNLAALTEGLRSIATGDFEEQDPGAYDELQSHVSTEAFDVLVKGVSIPTVGGTSAPELDLGVNHPNVVMMPRPLEPARVVDVGDLQDHGGLQTIDAAGLVCLPGRIIAVAAEELLQAPVDQTLERALQVGGTMLMVWVSGEQTQAIRDLQTHFSGRRPLINVGWATVDRALAASSPEVVLAEDRPATSTVDWALPTTVHDWLSEVAREAARFGMPNAKCVVRHSDANLVLAEVSEAPDDRSGNASEILRVRHAMINGSVVLRDRQLLAREAGAWFHPQRGGALRPQPAATTEGDK